jgi:type 1 glutamine amidotransferase
MKSLNYAARRSFMLGLASATFAAVPAMAVLTAAADEPAKIQVLLITGQDVAVHPWKVTSAAVAKILKDSGKCEVKVSEDLKPLDSAEELKKYDVIFYSRYHMGSDPSDAAKANLLEFVRSGKGFFVQHLASASFPKWDEFGKLCGRKWVMKTSGHGPRAVFDANITAVKSPITEGMKDFKADDELYAKLQGDEPIEVLISAESDWSHKTEPLLFVHSYGKGRVVHNAFGHDGKALETPEVKEIIARGVVWAAGK